MLNSPRIKTLLALIEPLDLNTHPFYESWRAGRLPVDKLQKYAAEYGSFIRTLGYGWHSLGLDQYVVEEADHTILWDRFASELGIGISAKLPHTKALVSVAQEMFSSRPEAVGALFAFEAQQPKTSASKLEGLDLHYEISDVAKEYFRVHARQHSEIDDLADLVETMSDEEFSRACSACRLMGSAMWSGLDGVLYSS